MKGCIELYTDFAVYCAVAYWIYDDIEGEWIEQRCYRVFRFVDECDE